MKDSGMKGSVQIGCPSCATLYYVQRHDQRGTCPRCGTVLDLDDIRKEMFGKLGH